MFLSSSPTTKTTISRAAACVGVRPATSGRTSPSTNASSWVEPVRSSPAVPNRFLSSGMSITSTKPSSTETRKVMTSPAASSPQ